MTMPMSPAGEDSFVRLTVYFSGSVQGVGFRFTTQQVARRFQVTGFVRNLPDGRVELVAEGLRTEVEAFIKAVEETMKGYIREAKRAESPGTQEFLGFSIRH